MIGRTVNKEVVTEIYRMCHVVGVQVSLEMLRSPWTSSGVLGISPMNEKGETPQKALEILRDSWKRRPLVPGYKPFEGQAGVLWRHLPPICQHGRGGDDGCAPEGFEAVGRSRWLRLCGEMVPAGQGSCHAATTKSLTSRKGDVVPYPASVVGHGWLGAKQNLEGGEGKAWDLLQEVERHLIQGCVVIAFAEDAGQSRGGRWGGKEEGLWFGKKSVHLGVEVGLVQTGDATQGCTCSELGNIHVKAYVPTAGFTCLCNGFCLEF